LVGRHLECVRNLGVLDVVCTDLTLAKVPEPCELAATVLVGVEVSEALVLFYE
jgi:hypothetical protein